MKSLTVAEAFQKACDGYDRLHTLLFTGYLDTATREAVKAAMNDFEEIKRTLEGLMP